MEEANEEAEQKGFCDTELSTNEQTRKEKTEAVETLHLAWAILIPWPTLEDFLLFCGFLVISWPFLGSGGVLKCS